MILTTQHRLFGDDHALSDVTQVNMCMSCIELSVGRFGRALFKTRLNSFGLNALMMLRLTFGNAIRWRMIIDAGHALEIDGE